ncbi:MAG: DUF349 domain-containing protein, partial [Prevotellaceae bacterium]|nr:DUF349 domain-containing protein [Prevotellaceae bacterium]
MDTPEHKDNAVSQVETDVISATENTAGNDKNASLPCIEQPVETVEEIVDNNSATEVAEKIFVASDDEKNLLEEEKSDDLDKKSDIAQENVAKNAGKRQKNYYALSREELLDELKELLVEPAYENIRTAAETIKQAFYKKQNTENEQAEKIIDAVEAEFKELLTKYRDLKAGMNAKIEEQKLKNLERKQAVLAKLEELTSSADDLSQTIPAFRKLQSEWKKIEQVPQSMVTEIWKQYSRYQEKFYDLIKINNDLREYDFKKNLEAKSALCEATEKLEEEQDAVLAFQQLQKMHEEWREIGPVSREFREEIWERFKNASSKINKKHQAYFESLKEIEEKNLRLKTELCE